MIPSHNHLENITPTSISMASSKIQTNTMSTRSQKILILSWPATSREGPTHLLFVCIIKICHMIEICQLPARVSINQTSQTIYQLTSRSAVDKTHKTLRSEIRSRVLRLQVQPQKIRPSKRCFQVLLGSQFRKPIMKFLKHRDRILIMNSRKRPFTQNR